MENEKVKDLIIVGVKTILVIASILLGLIFTDKYTEHSMSKRRIVAENKDVVIEDVPIEDEFLVKEEAHKKTSKNFVNEVKPLPQKIDTERPMIWAPEMTVYQKAQINIYEGVTASDNVDGDLSGVVVASSELDTSRVGTHTIQFSVNDKSGNVGVAERVFYVIANEERPPERTAVEQKSLSATKAIEPTVSIQNEAPTFSPMTLTINGTMIPYQNGGQGFGQSIIDANPNGVVSTWGGTAVQSANDGQNTHFIGHNPGIFSAVFSLAIGSQIIVTDVAGTPSTYVVQTQLQLDDYGNEIGSGTDYWDLVVGSGGGERITLQTCINEQTNLIMIAYKIE